MYLKHSDGVLGPNEMLFSSSITSITTGPAQINTLINGA